MLSTDTPVKIELPFAASGGRTTIPVPSQIGITDGAASWNDGFPPLTRIPPGSGGIPPNGLEMNGALFAVSAAAWWAQAGGNARFDSAHATAIGGYPSGAILQSSDGVGWWRSLTESNTSDPEVSGSSWAPHFAYGVTAVTLASSNVTLTPLQALRPRIVLTGTLGANVNLVLPTNTQEWLIVNSTTGSFTVTAKTAGGAGIVLANGANRVYGDGADINPLTVVSQSLGTSGWKKYPSGDMEQWGTIAVTSGVNVSVQPFTFPIPFVSAVYGVTGNADKRANGSWYPVVVLFESQALSGATMVADTTNAGQTMQAGINVKWRAWGRWR